MIPSFHHFQKRQFMRKIKCLVIDDEPPALEILKKHIARISALELTGTAINAVDALTMLQEKSIDLLLLDIQMPQILGTDFIRALKKPPKVIFTTAYRKFAVEGFELDAVDYLLKPISFERFLKAVNKVMDFQLKEGEPPSPLPSVSKNVDAFINFKVDRKVLKILLDDILYIESLKDYVKVFTKTKTVITKQSISALEEKLPRDSFTRIHRSYIVALNKIASYTTELIEIADKELPVSRLYRNELSKILRID
jgi:DNA-binding LytR/AlgR family response regulator